jgi:two-component system, NtrC family, sensor kinase
MQIKSLKTRIVLFMGILVILLMMVISIAILFQWRALILDNKRQTALSVARTFAASILDGLIYQESGLLPNEGYLENRIHDFLGKNTQIKWLVMYDRFGHVVVRSSYNGAAPESEESRAAAFPGGPEATWIYYSRNFGWILEVVLPLQIHSRSWGELYIGFDLDPTRAKLQRLFVYISGLTIVFVLSILAFIYFFINRLTKSLEQLVTEMNDFDLDNITPTQMQAGADEIGALVSNFEKMKGRLQQSRRQLLEAQRQIYRAEKLASIGRLASGVAHEVNNPLHGIKSCLYAIGREPENRDQLQRYLALADEALDHIATIVQKLLGFSRQHAKQVTAIAVNDEIEKVLSLLAFRLLKNEIIIERKLAPNLPELNADPNLIQEVIMNLLLNSVDAMEEGGTIRITTSRTAADRISIEITDTGCGIDSEDMDKIFDPFFTTKDEGKGTGLGLSVSLGIIESHGGTITCTSKPYRGTTFHITLPIQSLQ